MQMTDELSSAIDQHQRAVGALSEALDLYRAGGSELTEEAEPEPLDPAAQAYELTSMTVAGLIIEHLVVNSGDDDHIAQFDDDATTRLTALIAIDAEISKQAALLTELRTPQVPGASMETGQLTRSELADLGLGLAEASESMFEELRRGNEMSMQPAAPATPGPGSADQAVEHYIHAILDRAGDDIAGTLVGAWSWKARVLATLAELPHQVEGWPQEALSQLGRGVWVLRRLLARAWRQVLLKVSALVGQNATNVAETILEYFEPLCEAAKHGAGGTLGMILQAQKVVDQGEALVLQYPNRANAAILACRRVNDHHRQRRRAVPALNRTLPACRMVHVGGLALEAVAATVLLIYSVWLAHDHLDSPLLESVRSPKNPGLLAEIRLAMGQAANP